VFTPYFDNTVWTLGNYGSWNGSAWLTEDDGLEKLDLDDPIGGWPDGFKPTQVRVTFTGGGFSRLGILCLGNYLVHVPYGDLVSGEIYDLVWQAHYSDITKMIIYDDDDNPITVTNIEFGI
jgi:hypothetical protein